jgi:hypothetical protein
MLERRDLDERIAEIRNQRNQTESECVKLAAFLIIRNEFDKETNEEGGVTPTSPANSIETMIDNQGDSEFFRSIAGKPAPDVWKIIGETMDTLKLMEPRLYAGVLRKINNIE